jgi:hypothetical protein
MQSSPAALLTFALLGPNILLSILFSNILNLCPSVSVRVCRKLRCPLMTKRPY